MTTYPNTRIKPRDMQLADVITCTPGHAFTTGIVKRITDASVTIFRPYAVTADFSYTGGVICYTGVEEFVLPRDSDAEYELLSCTTHELLSCTTLK